MSDGNVGERVGGAAREIRDGAHFDVLIVGAGISGIGAAWHLQTQAPGKTYRIVETQAGFGGTWRTHTYPGVRSDSDLHTFGYRFKAWRGPPIATAQEILAYMGEVIDENDIARHIRYRTRVLTADWSETDCRWGWRWRTSTPVSASATRPASSGCARATTGTARATPRSGRAWTTSPGVSSTRRPGRRTWTTPASASWSSVRARRRRP
ncbi:MAG: NAD(P)-binding protein [Phenylobacterium sp.]